MKKKNYSFNLKVFSKVCLLSAGLIFSTAVFSADITTGLKLHYTFETVSGTNVPDDSGTGNVGTLQGTAAVTTGQSGQGLLMATAKADFVRLPADINVGLTSFTYATWVNLPALKNATRFFDFGNGADATNNFLAFIPSYNGDNGFVCLRYRPATGTAYNALSTVKIPVGVWAHVALTYTYSDVTSTGTATIYINGAASGTTTGMAFNPNTLGATADNYLGYSRWAQDTNGFNGAIDDVRLYDRALTANDILTLTGLAELNTQYTNLSLGDISALTANITLNRTLGTQGVSVRWTSSNPAAIDTLGNVVRPDKYNAPVKLTATLTQIVGDKTYSMTKEFLAIVSAFIPTPSEIAAWDFDGSLIKEENGVVTVADSKSGLIGTCMNDARIRTIGASTTGQYNVLDLGNGTGYFDMGTEIGKAIYSLTNYSMFGYFRIDDSYTALNSNGNFYWTFSNTNNADLDKNGYIIGSLKAQSHNVATNYYNIGNQSTGSNVNATKGGWHHFAYVQNGNIGTTYIDGVLSAENIAMTNLPALALPKTGLTGTPYNWLGRSNYINDVYLRSTLLYDFRVMSDPLSADDLNFDLEVPATLDKLNVAYNENPDYILPELTTEMNNLSLGDLTAVTSNITLPAKGVDATVSISWKSTNDKLINSTGVVTRPDYYSYPDTLTATLSKNGQKITKRFPATVVVKDGSQFANNLLVKYDFSSVADSTVTDAAEKHFTGTLKNKASVRTIGVATKYNVLSLGDSIGYFDMGPEVGKLMYNLNDYTMSAYYRIDTTYLSTELVKGGNYLWNFSNGTAEATNQNGYVIGTLNNQSVSITPKYYTAASGNQAVSLATVALKGGWHNLTYTQSGTTGTVYVDGMNMASGTITNLASTTLPNAGQLGTLYNWIGKSCFTGDVYLRKTLVYDFRLYKTALTEEQISNSVLNVGSTITALDVAYLETPSAVKSILNSNYKVVSIIGGIKILGLTGTEKISLYDIAGRQIRVINPTQIIANAGVYIIKIGNYTSKVVVK